jgi:methyl-accepting chemotaxis protein
MFGRSRGGLSFRQTTADFIFEHSLDPHIVWENGVIVDCNKAFETIMGQSKDRIIGTSPTDLSPEFQPCGKASGDFQPEIMRAVAQKGHHRFEWMAQTPGGKLLPVIVTVVKAELNGREIQICIWHNFRETYELRAAEQINRERQAAALEAQSVVTSSLAAALSQLARGNLVQRLTQPFATEYENLRSDFNAALSQLQETIMQVVTGSDTIQSGAREISTASDDLARRTEQQAASLEQTAAALDEITTTVKKAAEGAAHAREMVSVARSDAELSGEVTTRAVKAMAGIDRSSRQIGQIISVIDEIAFQTNLLALNAGVEAARAGDAGRGFAVVASEVRALAQRSAEAAKEIKVLILSSDRQVKDGVDLVGEVGNVLTRIVIQINDISGIVTEIAASAQVQSDGLSEVNIAVNQMDQVTQQNAAMVEETTAAAHSLASESDHLTDLISRFEVGKISMKSFSLVKRKAFSESTRPILRAVPAGPPNSGAFQNSKLARAAKTWEEF